MDYLLGIDVGTSGTKVALFDSLLKQIDSFTVEYGVKMPQPGWAEQDPEIWGNATILAINRVLLHSQINPSDIKSIGITGQMHGLVMLDENNKPLRPSIIWCDTRTEKECEEITNEIGFDKLISITANPALPGFTASKIRWVEKNEPQIFEKCKKIMLPKDYVRFLLTGTFASDVSDASGMQLLDIKARKWSPLMLSSLHITSKQLCTLYESVEISGKITSEASNATGLTIGTPVVAGAGDQAASAVGNGIVSPGDMSITIGSSGVVFAPTNQPIIDPKGRFHTFCHAIKNSWHVMGVTQGAGTSLKWFKDEFCDKEIIDAKKQGVDVYEILNRQIESVPVGSNGVIFLPYLQGERTPHLDAKAKGVFFGISAFHHKKHLLRSVMEGVSYSLLDCYNTLRESKLEAKTVRLAGGGSRSEVWTQMIADLFGVPIERTNVPDSGTLGCAILAGVGVGMFTSVKSACEKRIQKADTHIPRIEITKKYLSYYEIFHSLYPALKSSFDKISRIKE